MDVSVIGAQESFGSMMRTNLTGDSYIPWMYHSALKIKRTGWINPLTNIPFDKGIAKSLPRVRNEADLDRLVLDDLDHVKEPIRSVLHSFLVNLKAYCTSVPPARRILPIEEIYSRSLAEGPSFAKWLNGFKTYVLCVLSGRLYFNAEDLQPYDFMYDHVAEYASRNSEKRYAKSHERQSDALRTLRTQAISRYVTENNSFPKMENESVIIELEKKIQREKSMRGAEETRTAFEIGWLYRPNDLFLWEPPKLDVLTVSMEPINFEMGVLEEFRSEIRDYLNDDRFLLVNLDLPYFLGARDSTRKAKEGAQYRLPLTKPAKSRGPCRLAHIMRELKECRAACVEEHATLIRIRLIEMSVQRILEEDNRSVSKTSSSVLAERMKEGFAMKGTFGQRYKFKDERSLRLDKNDPSWTWSYCRDFKKEGLTKPRALLNIMLTELNKRWPEAEAFKYPGFFDNWMLEIDGEIHTPTRGHGLGMANALTSLMQIVIERMVSNRSGVKPKWSGYSNDDAAIIIPGYDNMLKWVHNDEIVCEQLSLKYKKAATFVSDKEIVLCETYVKKDNLFYGKKTSFNYITLGGLMKCINPSHARDCARSMNISNVDELWMGYVSSYWGWNLYRNEQREPVSTGGWWRAVKHGVDYSMYSRIADVELNQQQCAAFLAYERVKLRYKPWQKNHKFDTKLRQSDLAEAFLKVIDDKPINSSDMFRPTEDPDENTRAWRSYEFELHKAFRKNCSAMARGFLHVTWKEVYLRESERRLSEDILPPIGLREMHRSTEMALTTDFTYQHPYSKPDLLLAYELFANGEVPIDYVVKYGGVEPITLKSGSSRKDNIESKTYGRAMYLRPDKRDPLFLREWNRIAVPEGHHDVWHDPLAVTYVADKLGSRYRTPVCTIENVEKKKILSKKIAYYGDIPNDWLILISSLKPKDQCFVSKLRNIWIEPYFNGAHEKFVSLINLLRKYPGIGRNLVCQEKTPEEITELIGRIITARERQAELKQTAAEQRRLKVLYDSFNSPRPLFEGEDYAHPSRSIEKTGGKVYQLHKVEDTLIVDRFLEEEVIDAQKLMDIEFDVEVLPIGEIGEYSSDLNIIVEATDNFGWDDCVSNDVFDLG